MSAGARQAAAPRMLRNRGNTRMIIVGWLLMFGTVFWFFNSWSERDANPNRNVFAPADTEIRLVRNRAGHYVADGEINGERVTFMLDTGATTIALPGALARRLGLKLGSEVEISTAAGPAVAHPTRLASVRLASIEMRDLSAVVSERMQPDDVALLGMNFLKRLEMVQRGNELVLRPLAAKR
jgi:aspartyl protease family protein